MVEYESELSLARKAVDDAHEQVALQEAIVADLQAGTDLMACATEMLHQFRAVLRRSERRLAVLSKGDECL
jgi:predicted RNA methylase